MIKDVEVAINIPSGRMVVDNDIRCLFPEVREARYISGQGVRFWAKYFTEAYAKAGLLHGFVGNSCPGVYKDGNTLYIGNQPWDEEWFEYKDEPYVEYPKIPGEHVAGVCTDLWWYCICDYDEFIRRGGKIGKYGPDIVKVTPGRYILSHHWPYTDAEDSYRPQRMIYATLRLDYRKLEPWYLPEEDVFREIHRIFPEVDWVWIKEMESGRFEIFVVIDDAHGLGHCSAKFEISAELVNEGDYGSIAVLVKKGLRKSLRMNRETKRFYKNFRKLADAERKRQLEVAMKVLDSMDSERRE